jgi:hypothetical protein
MGCGVRLHVHLRCESSVCICAVCWVAGLRPGQLPAVRSALTPQWWLSFSIQNECCFGHDVLHATPLPKKVQYAWRVCYAGEFLWWEVSALIRTSGLLLARARLCQASVDWCTYRRTCAACCTLSMTSMLCLLGCVLQSQPGRPVAACYCWIGC